MNGTKLCQVIQWDGSVTKKICLKIVQIDSKDLLRCNYCPKSADSADNVEKSRVFLMFCII